MSPKLVKSILFFFLGILVVYAQEEKSHFNEAINKQIRQYKDLKLLNATKKFYLEKEWDSVLIYSLRQLNEKTSKKEVFDFCNLFRGISFKEKGLLKEAENSFKLISEDFIFNDNINFILAEIYLIQGQSDKALRRYLKIEEIKNIEERPEINKINIHHSIGICYLKLRKYNEAEKYLLPTLKELEVIGDTLTLISANINTANLYYYQYRDEEAIPYFEKSYALAQHINDFDKKRKVAKNMAVVEENRGNYKASIKYIKEYDKWKDSLNNQNKIWEVAQFEKRFAVAQKQQEVNVLKAENRAKLAERNGLMFSAGILLLLLLTLTYFYREKLKTNKVITNQNEQLDELNATKDKLFSIVSHDLRSSVNSLKLSNKKLLKNLEKENISVVFDLLKQNSNTVGRAYNLLDNLLNWALLQTKQSYFEIKENHLFHVVEHVVYNYQSIIKEKDLLFKNGVSKHDRVFADQESLKIILRNLLDNAIKFSQPGDSISIYSRDVTTKYIEIIIEDTGLGIDEETRKTLEEIRNISVQERKHKNIEGSGLGLQLCKSMIVKNKGKFSIESEVGKGTKMIVFLPKTPNNE